MDPASASEFDLADILKRCQRSEVPALESLHDYFHPKLLRYTIYRLGEGHASEETTSEVLIRLVEAIRVRIRARDLPGWLFRKAAEQVEERQKAALPPKPDFPAESGEDEPNLGKYGIFFRRSLRKLAPEHQHFMALRFSQQVSLDEIAGWLGMREFAIRRLQYQALNALLAALGGKAVGNGEDEARERALQVCLGKMTTVSQLEEIALAYPRWSGELNALLEVAHFAQFPGGIDPNQPVNLTAEMPEFEAARQQSQVEFILAVQNTLKKSKTPQRMQWILAGIGLVVVSAACLGLMAALSRQARPGDLLYGARRNMERLQAGWTQSASTRLELEMMSDQQGLRLVEKMLEGGQPGPVSFSANLDRMEGERWQVGGLPVYVLPDTHIIGDIYPGYIVSVEGEITAQGMLQANRLKMRTYQIGDRVESITAERLLLGDLEVALTPETIQHGSPQPGTRVMANLWMPSSMLPQARLIEVVE